MLRLRRARGPRTFARALALLLPLACAGVAAAADLATLQGHAQGRRALVEGDLKAAQDVWDGVLTNRRGRLHAITLERTCDRAELAASLARRRGLSPVWVAGGDCATLLWGAFDSAEEAEAQLAALPTGALPAGARVVELSAPLAALTVDAPPPGPLARVAKAEPPPEPMPPEPEQAEPPAEPAPREPEPVSPRVTMPREPEVQETAVDATPAETPAAVEPEPTAAVAEATPPRVEPREVVPEPAPPAPRAEPREVVPEPLPPAVEPETAEPVATPREVPRAPATPQAPAAEPARQRRIPETPPPLPTEPEGLTDEEREVRRARAAASFAEGNALWAGGEYASAIDAFETALELDPSNARILNNLGTAWLKAERPERAVAVLSRAVELDPLYARAFLNLSTALYASERPDEALGSLQKVIDLEPANLDARYNKAAVLAELRRWDDARQALIDGLDIAPGDARLLEFLSQVEQQMAVLASPPSEAAAAARAPIEACQGIASDVMRARRAAELFSQGEKATAARDWVGAERSFLGVLDCDPTSPAAANRLGVARLRRGDASGARQAFDLASRLDPKYLEARTNGCLAAFAAEDCESATTCLRRLTEDAGSFAPGWREFALMLYRCGRSIEAESAAVRGLELAPNDARLRGLLERIQGERVAAPR